MTTHAEFNSETMNMGALVEQAHVVYDQKSMPMRAALDKALADVTYKATRFRKAGSITMKIDIKPGSMNRMTIIPTVSVTEPKSEPLPMDAWVDSSGRLYGEDPDQMRLALSNVESMEERHNKGAAN